LPSLRAKAEFRGKKAGGKRKKVSRPEERKVDARPKKGDRKNIAASAPFGRLRHERRLLIVLYTKKIQQAKGFCRGQMKKKSSWTEEEASNYSAATGDRAVREDSTKE